jgi:flagellar assembly protein FliH
MKLSGRQVIKAADVKFFRTPEEQGPRSDGLASGRSREEVARKIRITEREFYERGFSDGLRRGRELEKNEALQTLQTMSMIIKEASTLKKSMLDNLEEEIIQLSLAIAAKVIHVEATTNREVIRGVLKEAIKSIDDRENMKVRIHPRDFHYMVEIKNDFLQSFDGIRNLIFVEDESIQQGGAIIETVCGEVDARLDQQCHEIEAAMTASKRD